MVRTRRGTAKLSSIFAIFLSGDSSGRWPMGNWWSGALRVSAVGRKWWLHLRITCPPFSSSSPGLLRMMVFSVVASQVQKGYYAPVRLRHRSMPLSPLDVRQ